MRSSVSVVDARVACRIRMRLAPFQNLAASAYRRFPIQSQIAAILIDIRVIFPPHWINA
jgi:hypothetical protein